MGASNNRTHVRVRWKGLEVFREPICVAADGPCHAQALARAEIERFQSSMAFAISLDSLTYALSDCPGECQGWRPEFHDLVPEGSDGD